jgi:hypothetical protein
MVASCFNVVRGKRVRVTRLDACGAYPVPTTANSFVASDGFISVQYSLDYEDGDEHIQKNADGALCINDKTCDVYKRTNVTISFCGVDPDMFSLITANAVELDASGVDVGFRVSEGISCSNFAFELWSGLGGNDCPNTNEVQSLTVGGAGLTSFTLTYPGTPGPSGTTTSIAVPATAAAVQAGLESLDAIDPGDVSVTGPAGSSTGPWLVTFIGRYAGQNVPQMTSTPTGGTGTLTVATVTGGGVSTGASYGYFLLPFVKNGTLRDFTVENGPTTFEIQAWTESGPNWGAGPYNVVAAGAAGVPSALKVPMSSLDHMLIRLTTVAPPASVCGYQSMPAAPTPAA